MAEKNKKIETPPQAKPKKKRKVLSFIFLMLTVFLLSLVLLVSLTQTKPFKNWLTGYITDKINESFAEKDSHLSFGSLDGNFFSEIVLTDAVLKVKTDEMMKFEKLKIKFDIFGLLDKKINLKEVILQNPNVNFVKVKNAKGDSVWNFAYLFSSDKEKDTAKTDFEWKITVERLRIENLNLVMLGSKPQDIPVSALNISPSKNLDISNLKISSFTLETSAYYDKNSTQLQIAYIGFNSNFGFDLKGLSGNFFISESRAEVNKLNIETARSWIQMDYVFIDKLNLMKIDGLPSFKGKDMRLHMTAKKIDFDDLKCFLEPLNFLDGKVYCDIKCDGKFNDINIDNCSLKTENSDMNFHGRMVNLIDPEHLWFDVAGENLIMDPVDTKVHVPGLPIPDYSYLGKVTGSFTYKGEPLNFQTTYDVRSSAGDAKGNFSMNLTTPAIDYSGYVETRGGNIGKVIKNDKLLSDLNGKVEFSGSGFSLANIHTKLTYELTNSKLGEYSFENSSGTISLNNYNIEADVKYISKDASAQLNGTINVADFNNPHYDLKGKVGNLNIAAFTKNPEDKSNLNLSFDVKGNGYSLNNLQGDYNMDVAKSYYGKFDIPATPVKLIVQTGGTNDLVSFTSNLFDFKANGEFKIEQIGDILLNNLNMISNQVAKKFNLDTLLPQKQAGIPAANVNFRYEFKTKNPEAVNRMLYFEDMDIGMSIKGFIKNTPQGFESQGNLLIDKFKYRDSVFAISNAHLDIFLNNDYSKLVDKKTGDLNSLYAYLDFAAEKLILNKSVIDSASFHGEMNDGKEYFNAFAKKDTMIRARLAGNMDFNSDSVVVNLSRVFARYNRVSLRNQDSLIISYSPYGDKNIKFDQFNVSGDYLKLTLGGFYSLAGESDIWAEMDNISIPAVTELIEDPESVYMRKAKRENYQTPIRGDIRRVFLSYKGNEANPVFGLELNTGLIRYENTKIGRVDAFIDYAKNTLSTDILVSNSLGNGTMRLTGDVPFNNPLVSTDTAAYFNAMENPVDLKLKAKDFQINFFSKLIPNFADIKGFLNGEIASSGTISEPVLTGGMTIDKGRFFLEINNLYYRFNASLRADKSDLVVDNFRVFYIDDDRRHMDAWGRINFAGLHLNWIDLTTSGDVKVLDRSSRKNRFGFYGDMVAGVGNPAITIKGDLNRLYVTGQLRIKQGNLLFPSIQGLEYNVYADDFIYRILNDSTGSKYLDTTVIVEKDKLDEIDPFLRYNYQLANKPVSFADNIVYDLNVVTDKNIYASINFNELTREELFGEIQANLNIENRTNKDFNFYGNMEIVGDSYYRIYYKNFKIENSRLVFEGPYDNPSLQINAKYKNVSAENGKQEIVYVVLNISGTRYKPVLSFKLQDESGLAIGGPDEGSNALSYLIFGVKQSDVRGANTQILSGLGNNALSNISSSYLSSLVRNIAPFILNTEVIYEGGNFANSTDIRITSEIGGALVKFGGKVLTDLNNAEVSVEYPLNRLLNMNISNNLILEIKREVSLSQFTAKNTIETSVGLTYKINF